MIPLNLGNSHWALLIPHKNMNLLKRIETRVVSFGDILVYECPPCILKFLKAIFDHVFLHPGVRWTKSTKNYMLHDMRFERQGDYYTCRAYVLAGCSTFAESSGFLSK